MNKYIKLKNKHEKEINNFPMFFAFDDKQFEKGLKKLNTTKKDIFSIGMGGFIRKVDRHKYNDLFKKQYEEEKEAKKDDIYLYQGFRHELSNHEFIITYDYTDTLNCFGLEYDKLTDKELKILEKAKNDYLKNMEEVEINGNVWKCWSNKWWP